MSARRTLRVLQINDTHAYMEPHPELFREGGRTVYRTAGGFARIATLLRRARAEQEATFTFDNGDTLHGTYPAVETRGAAPVETLNLLGLDAWTGHWDFAYGPDRFREIDGLLEYPFLAANAFDDRTGSPAFAPTTVVERGGVRVGVVGLAATILDKGMPPRFSEGLRFTLGREELPGHVQALREEADVVVLLSHLGFPQDLQLARDVEGIDVVLSGHTHNRTYDPVRVGETWVMQSGCHGSFVGQLDLEVVDGRVGLVEHRLIPVDDTIATAPDVAAAVERAVAPHREALAEVVGYTETPLDRGGVFEATMDNLLLQAVADAAGAPVAFSNGWRYGAPIPAGPVTLGDLWAIIPPNPPVSVVDLTGAEVREMLEANLEHTFSRNPYHQAGGYVKRCLGLTAYVKVENPGGARIQELFVGGERLDEERTYPVSFVTSQGVPTAYGTNRRHLDVRAVDALRDYFTRPRPARADLRGTFVAI